MQSGDPGNNFFTSWSFSGLFPMYIVHKLLEFKILSYWEKKCGDYYLTIPCTFISFFQAILIAQAVKYSLHSSQKLHLQYNKAPIIHLVATNSNEVFMQSALQQTLKHTTKQDQKSVSPAKLLLQVCHILLALSKECQLCFNEVIQTTKMMSLGKQTNKHIFSSWQELSFIVKRQLNIFLI